VEESFAANEYDPDSSLCLVMMMMMMIMMMMLMRTSSRNNTFEMVFMSIHFFIFKCRYEGKREKISGSSLSTMATPTISQELEGFG